MSSTRDILSRVLREVEALRHPILRRVVRAGFIGGAAGLLILATLALTGGELAPWVLVGTGIIGGMAGSLFARSLRPLADHLLGVSTNARLLELSNPAHPLMRDLITRAPGTYTHSVVTANLAEVGAEAVGADRLLARVGAYYHDVGKLMRPEYFFENLSGGVNPHEDATPGHSAEIIRQHVGDGVDLAGAYGLPKEVTRIIGQHHGTSVVRYFYRKAAELDATVFESDFRYQGDRPRSKEAALVMLADGAEAAVRAIRVPSDSQIESTVRGMIAERLTDHQLDDSGLASKDIEALIEAFTRMLSSMYHPRVEYPEATPRSGHADLRHEPSRA